MGPSDPLAAEDPGVPPLRPGFLVWGVPPDFQPRPGEIVVQEHWGSSGFANTDLDMQLKQHGVTHVILVGVLANTCVEATARFATELGYHMTLVSDATAALGPEMTHAAHELNGPTYAQAIVTTNQLITAFNGSRDDGRLARVEAAVPLRNTSPCGLTSLNPLLVRGPC
ncbi:isochorismatase family cysteine hydrolase [Streptomyces hirsutus]|uniref:isochorismatase family cysteine hydrolase n=1 Tax=Streptomyces hirsutus TaxID=35620 RepID=UPI00386A25FA